MRNDLIYLDSAATSLQKPKQVGAAMLTAMQTMASPGRGGHRPAMLAAETAFQCRSEIADMFNVHDPADVIFTMNATHALNIAIHSMVRPGDRVVTSGYEHNSVTRALHLCGAQIDVASSPLFDPDAAVQAFCAKLTGAKAAVVCHVSNVFGYILPIERIAELCRKENVPLLIDASQSAGCLPLDIEELGASYIAMPGHKGLLGPQGTGVLLCGTSADPLIAGGTGSESLNIEMPDYLPDRLEAGTHNITGIAGLLAGVRWVKRNRIDRILSHERLLLREMTEKLEHIDGIRIFRASDPANQTGVLSFRVHNTDGETFATLLGEQNVAVRAGYHCAPLAHQTAGTIDTGTVRLSFSPFNTLSEVCEAANRIKICIKKI